MYRLTAICAVCLLLVSGCSTKPCLIENPKPPIPEADLVLAPPLPYHVEEGTMGEVSGLLIVVTGRYYELRSRFNELVEKVRSRQ